MRFWTQILVVLGLQFPMTVVPQLKHAIAIDSRAIEPCTKTVFPGQSMAEKVDSAIAGDVICVRPGTYHETIGIAGSGTASAPIIIRGDGGRPIIDGQFTLPANNGMDLSTPPQGCPGSVDGRLPDGTPARQRFECGGYHPLVILAGNFITFEGFEVINSTGAGISAVGNSVLTNITIRNNYVHSVRGNGILLWKVNHALVEHNEVADAGNFAPFWRLASALEWGSGIGAHASHFVVFNTNVIHENWGDALLVDINTGGSTDVTVENNVFYNNYSSNGLYAHAVKRIVIQRNLTYCATENPIQNSSSLRIAPTEPQFEDIQTKDVTVLNNIFAGCPTAGIFLIDTKPRVRWISNLVFAKNTFYRGGESISLSGPGDEFVRNFSANSNLIVDAAFSISGFISLNNRVVSSGNNALFWGLDGQGTLPRVLTAGKVDPQWFRLKNYEGVGADVSGFVKAGLLAGPAP
jgi:hypothetical protein